MCSGIHHIAIANGRVYCGNNRAGLAGTVEYFRQLLAAPIGLVPSHGGTLDIRVCKRCADKLAASDARKAKKATVAA